MLQNLTALINYFNNINCNPFKKTMDSFSKFFTLVITLIMIPSIVIAKQCPEKYQIDIQMSDHWHKKEEKRLKIENSLLKEYSKYIIRRNKRLIPEKFYCEKEIKSTCAVNKKKGIIHKPDSEDCFIENDCDPLKNCQMVTKKENLKSLQEIEYLMKTDAGFTIAKSYCTKIGKCIGYNEFFHDTKITAQEDRLIDIKNDNAIFYHYFYSAHSQSYEPPYNITNLKSGNELYLNDKPHFSPNGKIMVEIRSIPKQAIKIGDSEGNFPTGFSINLYELGENGEYQKITPPQDNPLGPIDTSLPFLSTNPKCGKTPHFHSWKNNQEIRLSSLHPEKSDNGDRTILSYDKKAKKWGCRKNFFPEPKCESFTPDEIDFVSNLSMEQLRNCR